MLVDRFKKDMSYVDIANKYGKSKSNVSQIFISLPPFAFTVHARRAILTHRLRVVLKRVDLTELKSVFDEIKDEVLGDLFGGSCCKANRVSFRYKYGWGAQKPRSPERGFVSLLNEKTTTQTEQKGCRLRSFKGEGKGAYDTKTAASVQSVPMPQVLIECLKEHRKRRRNRKYDTGISFTDDDDLVFSNEEGELRTYYGTRAMFGSFMEM